MHCVKIANDGLVYVCDRSNDRLQVFHKDGTFVREWIYLPQTLSGSVWDLYLWPDKEQSFLIMVDGGNNEMRVVRRSDGEVVGTYGRFGRMAGQFFGVHNVAIDSARQCVHHRGVRGQAHPEMEGRQRRAAEIAVPRRLV